LVVFTIIATLIAHRFWEFEGAARQMQQGQFFKNLGIVGGYLALCVSGGGRYALERLGRRDHRRIERPVTERRVGERRTKAATVPEVGF